MFMALGLGQAFTTMASTVGGAMLAADPTAGAFRSAGIGLGLNLAKSKQHSKEQRLQEDRAIGLKAFEMAKRDVDSARNLINEYALLQSQKRMQTTKVTEMLVTNPEGIVVSGVFYESGSRPLLTESEIFANRSKLSRCSRLHLQVGRFLMLALLPYIKAELMQKKPLKGLGLTRESPYFESAVQAVTF